MKVSIEEISIDLEEEILIRCHKVNDGIYEIVNKIEAEDPILLGYQDDRIYRIHLRDIYYFESVDGKVYMYVKENVFEVKQKLYELEEQFKDKKCFRASKSTILNMTKISNVYPKLY